ncbi:hypothetical protein BZB76_4979 [Actinomadura pelletieri DSM 43383]|uniref:Uncharacterized protein n=1 Tax=Actinomadura pelletieri DSM 43383 TaxID=1120940 RepID=A0A495QJ19_9ACTN|nr:hypothetical protein [Actinomadura pelletieri]RKS72162.1 hypothetical protein BZB76_4979 [Actinomadura pelletieri DSM 43383]
MKNVANPASSGDGEVEAVLKRLSDAHADWAFQVLPVTELPWEAFRKTGRFRVGGGVGWLRAESAERLGRQISAVERAEAELDAIDAQSAGAGMPTGSKNPRVLEELERLRAGHPGWQIEYAGGRDVPWVAFRDRGANWMGGHPTAEATDPVELESLIEQAVQLEVESGTPTERCVR